MAELTHSQFTHSELIPWDRERISREGWRRFVIGLPDRAAGRALIGEIRHWFLTHGRGQAMIFDDIFCVEVAVAFSDLTDSMLFRLNFAGMQIDYVPQPHSHLGYRMS